MNDRNYYLRNNLFAKYLLIILKMKRNVQVFWWCVVALFCSFRSLAQRDAYTTQSSKAIKNLEAAGKYLDVNNLDKAISSLNDAIKADANFMEAHMMLGDIYFQMDETKRAIDEYQKAVTISPGAYPTSLFTLGIYLMDDMQYKPAKESFLKFISLPNAKPDKKLTAEKKILSCEFAINALNSPVSFTPENMGERINSNNDEYYPSLTVDEKQFLYTRRLVDNNAQMGFQEDFYLSLRNDQSEWSKSLPLGPTVNSHLNEGAPSFSPDGKLIFFVACDRPEGKGSCDIYYSRKRTNGWTKPLNIGAPVNTGAWESQPCFSSDGKTLYFVRGSGARSGLQDQDIYTSTVSENGWSTPVKLSNKINTEDREESPFIHPDNQTLYFISNGHPGMGGMDIFVSKRQPDGSWGEPVNLGYPINSSRDESGLIVDPKGSKAYYSSDRVGGMGGLDLYSFPLDEKLRPVPVTYVHGVVKDAATSENLEARFEIIDIESNKIIIESYSEKSSGEFFVTVPTGKSYALNVSKTGYLFYSENFRVTDPLKINEAFKMNISLEPVKEGASVILKNIFFDTNSSDLKPESKTELEKLSAFLKQNAKVKVEISGHTDNVGEDKSNLFLSDKRAKSVVDYIIKSGIAAERLLAKGYGETKPITTNDSEEGRAKNRRTECKITSVM